MSPLAWDLGHVAAYEDLWLNHRLAGRELLREDLAALYDAFETPRQVRGDLEFLRGEELREYMAAVRERALEAPVTDGELHELVIRHELQHTETMLQAMSARRRRCRRRFAGPARVAGTGLEMVEVPEGPFEIGAAAEGFAYDNERPRHTRVDRRASRSAARRSPTPPGSRSPRAAATSAASGGPTRAGRGRRSTTSPTTPGRGRGSGRARRPRLLVRGRRLRPRPRGAPADRDRVGEGGDLGPARGRPGRSGSGPSSHFTGYPGFVAHPYREYSEVFFGDRYRVLRGGSCATHPRVASTQFRNWDLPERRQLFAGVRIAR